MTIYIVDLEAVDTRYTKEWKYNLPKQMKRATNQNVVTISGGNTPQATSNTQQATTSIHKKASNKQHTTTDTQQTTNSKHQTTTSQHKTTTIKT